MVAQRAEQGKNYGVVLVPEGLVEHVQEVAVLLQVGLRGEGGQGGVRQGESGGVGHVQEVALLLQVGGVAGLRGDGCGWAAGGEGGSCTARGTLVAA
jgi:hypothetical protein